MGWNEFVVDVRGLQRLITINILEILELPIFAYHTYYTSKHMYNWMKWLRLLGGWHFIAATAIKPPKAACQFAADDILLYKFCYNIQWIYFTIWEKGKEELSPLQYHFKSLHIISRHYKKSLLRSQIYHGYEELSTDTNYPIWRRQKLPYMKKTRKKKQVCGAACFMAAEIKFSEDVRPSVTPFWQCSCHGIILKFSGSYYHWQTRCPCKSSRSKVKVTEVMTPFSRFWTLAPVWIHIWQWNDAQSLMLIRRGTLLFFKVKCQISGSQARILVQIGRFRTVTPVWIHHWLRSDAQRLKQHRRGALLFFKVICKFSRSCGTKNCQFLPDLRVWGCNSSLTTPMDLKWCIKLEVVYKRCPVVFQGHMSIFKVTRDKKSPILTRIECFRIVTPVWICQWLWNAAQSLM